MEKVIESKCFDHTGCVARIKCLEEDKEVQWQKIDLLQIKLDSIHSLQTTILGGVVVSIVLLLFNIIFKKIGG